MIRIGQGFDVHAFGGRGPLMLGGTTVPCERGLTGHSDADVLLHAITDACLGAFAKGDIGTWFPPTDEAYRDADSRQLLCSVLQQPFMTPWRLVNLDSTIVADSPKIGPYSEQMRITIAGLFQVTRKSVCVKATTCESLGFIGRREGIAAMAVALFEKSV